MEKNPVSHLMNDDPSEFKNDIYSMLASKIRDRLDIEYANVGSNMFQKQDKSDD